MSDFDLNEKSDEESFQNLNLLLIAVKNQKIIDFASAAKVTKIDSVEELSLLNKNKEKFNFIVLDSAKKVEIDKIRSIDLFIPIPILIILNSFESKNNFEEVTDLPRLILCNTCAFSMAQFKKQLTLIAQGKKRILPSKTGLIVKYTIFFINNEIGKQLTRGRLAEKAGVTEDYLTRIFHKEMGMSLWSYLNSYRMFYATKLLLQSDDSIYSIAEEAGFPDAAYFNKVFHKQFGMTPGAFRKAGLPS